MLLPSCYIAATLKVLWSSRVPCAAAWQSKPALNCRSASRFAIFPRPPAERFNDANWLKLLARGDFDAELAEIAAAENIESAAGSTSLSELEQQLLAICAEVVVDRKIGVDEDLFDAGVNSLALVEIHERIEEKFPGRLEVEDLFEMPSVRSLAAHLAATSCGLNGARGRTRTGKGLPPRDFLTRYDFRRCLPAFGVWTFSSPYPELRT